MYRVLFLWMFLSTYVLRAATVVVTVGDGGNFFSPAHFTINPGDTVKWVWIAGHHNTTPMTMPTGAATWYSNIDASKTTYSYVPTTSGLYNYTCTHHSGMDASFFVTGCGYPAKPVISGSSFVCKKDTITISIPTQAGATYQWVHNSSGVAGAATNTLRVTESGNYRAIVNRCGVDSASATFVIAAYPSRPSFTYTNSGLAYSFTNTTVALSAHTYIWDFGDGSATATTIDAAHSYAVSGNYIVTLQAIDIVNGCTDTTQVQLQAGLGIDTVKATQYSVYPNPAKEVLYIDAPAEMQLSLMNSMGVQQYVSIEREAHRYKVNTANVPTGMYMLRMLSAQGIFSQKVVIIK